MAVKVKIPTGLQNLTQGRIDVEGTPGRIIELIDNLDSSPASDRGFQREGRSGDL